MANMHSTFASHRPPAARPDRRRDRNISRLILVWMLLLVAIPALAQDPASGTPAATPPRNGCSAADAAALQGMVEQWKDGYNSGHAAQVAALYRADAYYLTQHFATGIVAGRANIQAYVQRGVDARFHIDSITMLAMDCSGDLAYVIDRYESTNAGQKAFGLNLVVSRKSGGKWLIVAHEAAVPEPTAIQRLDAR
ncbi:MAG: YybH family protein [Bryobacteraceae bacterium]